MEETADEWEQLSELRRKVERQLLLAIIKLSEEGATPADTWLIATNAYKNYREALADK